MANGNGDFQKVMATLFVALLVGFGALCITGYFDLDKKVLAKEEKAIKEHSEIRKEFAVSDEKVKDKLEKKIEEVISAQTLMLVQQGQMSVILEKIEKKLN